MASVSRQNVASGGIYDLPRVSYSESTRLLLKELLQEAAVNLQHQRRIERWVSGGRSLPHHEALADPSQPTPGQRRPSSSSSSSSFRKTPRPCIQTKRSHEVIKKMGLYEPNTHYVPPPPRDGKLLVNVHFENNQKYSTCYVQTVEVCVLGKEYGPESKERCQELMAFGKEGVTTHPTPGRKTQVYSLPSETDRFTELVSEMEERVHWLEAMEALGEGEKFRHLIAAQLALKLRDLELIDQERARDLDRAMKLKMAAAPTHKLTKN